MKQDFQEFNSYSLRIEAIASGRDEVVCCAGENELPSLYSRCREKNVENVPIVRDGLLTKYARLTKSFSQYEIINVEPGQIFDVRDDCAKVLDSLSHKEYSIFFLTDSGTFAGLFAVMDFEKPFFKAHIYYRFCHLEMEICKRVTGLLNRNQNAMPWVLTSGGDDKARKVMNRIKKDTRRGIDRFPVWYLDLALLLKEALHHNAIDISERDIETLVKVRNVIAHPVNPLFENGDVKRVVESLQIIDHHLGRENIVK